MALRVVFAGPSIYGADLDFTDIELRAPAEQGDIERAVADGAKVVGLIDGHYQQVRSVWHKEILHALKLGVAVYGASSMGALRAAECHRFGMRPIGEIAEGYCAGRLYDDADVALLNGPAELNYCPLTEPLVDALATIKALLLAERISTSEGDCLTKAARSLFFADRTAETIVMEARLGTRANAVLAAFLAHHVSLKTRDAAKLLTAVRLHVGVSELKEDWDFAQSPFWRDRQPHSSAVTTP